MPLIFTGGVNLSGAVEATGSGYVPPPPTYYWIGTLRSAGVGELGMDIAVDGSGNTYLGGSSFTSTVMAKFDSSGSIQWQRTLQGSINQSISSVAVDGSGNPYFTGYWESPTTDYNILTGKYDPTGALQWQRSLSSAIREPETGNAIAVDSAGNSYVCAYANASGTTTANLAKYDSSGNLQWQRKLMDQTQNIGARGWGVGVDGSGNAYVTGYGSATAGTSNDILIAKYNSSGAIQWQRKFQTQGSSQDVGYGLAVDTAGNSYITGYTSFGYLDSPSTASDMFLLKYNTSGALQWQRALKTAGAVTEQGYAVAADTLGNVYVGGITGNSADNILIAKYDSSGALTWQRTLASTGVEYLRGITTDSAGNYYIAGYTNVGGNNDMLFAKLPGDGSLTGSYTVNGSSFVYAVGTLTSVTTTFSDSAGVLVDGAGTLTTATTTLANNTAVLTPSVTTFTV